MLYNKTPSSRSSTHVIILYFNKSFFSGINPYTLLLLYSLLYVCHFKSHSSLDKLHVPPPFNIEQDFYFCFVIFVGIFRRWKCGPWASFIYTDRYEFEKMHSCDSERCISKDRTMWHWLTANETLFKLFFRPD